MKWVQNKQGFTIVELLIVIVVIGILAAITIAAYTGISNRAAQSVAQTAAQQANKKIQTFAISNNETAPDTLATINIASDNTTNYQYTLISSASRPNQYCVTTTVKTFSYYIGYDMSTNTWVTNPKEGACPDHFAANSKVKQVVGSYDYQCLIASDNLPYCWGQGGEHLGIASSSGNYVYNPTKVSTTGALNGKTVKVIGIAGDQGMSTRHTCVIASDDLPYCWGNAHLGTASPTSSNVPVAVTTSGVLSGKTVTALAVGYNHTCVTASDGRAYCWGYQADGQLGTGVSGNSTTPLAVDAFGVLSGKQLKQIYAGYNHTCAVSSDGLGYCWGANNYGQLGTGTSGSASLAPVAVKMTGALAGKTIRTMTVGTTNSCAIASDGKAYCWGGNFSGENGNAVTASQPEPVAVDATGVLSGKTILSIASASPNLYRYGTCVVASDLRSYCWGTQHTSTNNSTTNVPVLLSNGADMNGVLSKRAVHGSAGMFVIGGDGELYRYGYFNADPVKVVLP